MASQNQKLSPFSNIHIGMTCVGRLASDGDPVTIYIIIFGYLGLMLITLAFRMKDDDFYEIPGKNKSPQLFMDMMRV